MDGKLQDAYEYFKNNPGSKLKTVAREFSVSRDRLRTLLNGGNGKRGPKHGITKLSPAEENAVCRYIDRIDRISLAVRAEFITDAANFVLQQRASSLAEPQTVGVNWTSRFIKRHGYNRRLQKTLDADRESSEDVNRVNEYYVKLDKIVQEEGIIPEDMWNMDETGFRIGMGKDQLVITKRKRAHYFNIPESRESATAIEAINAAGGYIPLFLLLAGQVNMASWDALPELSADTAIIPSTSGYSNDEICLEWVKHFDKYTKKFNSDGTPNRRQKRLLLLNGHGSHHTIEFIEYCDENGIIPFGMPPNLTHLLQPLDVVVFQPLMHYHTKALDVMVRDGIDKISKIEFLSIIQNVRIQAFKEDTIRSGFQKTGIYPFNPLVVLRKLEERAANATTPPPPILSSSPIGTPVTLRQMHRVSARVEAFMETSSVITPEAARDINRIVKASISNTAELILAKRDLGRARNAERVRKQRRAVKNTPLKSGGVLTGADDRAMVKQREDNLLEEARRIVEAAELKLKNDHKKWYFEAAKKARKWRIIGKLDPAVVYETGKKCKYLKRF